MLVGGLWLGLPNLFGEKPQADLVCRQLGYVMPGVSTNLFYEVWQFEVLCN